MSDLYDDEPDEYEDALKVFRGILVALAVVVTFGIVTIAVFW